MTSLLRKPKGTRGLVHDISPEAAGWTYVGFALHRLAPGDTAEGATGAREAIIVVVEGHARLTGAKRDFGLQGTRDSLWERKAPAAIYLPPGSGWTARAESDAVIAVCTAPGGGGDHAAQVIGPEGIHQVQRGRDANTRFVNPIAMEDRDVAASLLVTEVYTPQGNWSSYPSHRHDEDDFPNMTMLEETYYHRLRPAQGFAFQRVYTEDGALDETMSVADHDVVLVPKGHHPCAAPYGYDLYYLNVMAGPLRKWRFRNDPAHDWIFQRDLGP